LAFFVDTFSFFSITSFSLHARFVAMPESDVFIGSLPPFTCSYHFAFIIEPLLFIPPTYAAQPLFTRLFFRSFLPDY